MSVYNKYFMIKDNLIYVIYPTCDFYWYAICLGLPEMIWNWKEKLIVDITLTNKNNLIFVISQDQFNFISTFYHNLVQNLYPDCKVFRGICRGHLRSTVELVHQRLLSCSKHYTTLNHLFFLFLAWELLGCTWLLPLLWRHMWNDRAALSSIWTLECWETSLKTWADDFFIPYSATLCFLGSEAVPLLYLVLKE